MNASKIPNSLEKPDVFVSEATKRTPKWTKAMCDWVIATAHSNNDKAEIKAFLDAANGIVDESTYKYVMATYNSVNGRKEDLPGKIRDVDFITPIKEKYIGEFINTYNNYQVYNADIDIVTKRNKDLRVALDSLLRQQFINIMNANGVQTGEPSKELPSAEDFMKEAAKDWIDEEALKGQRTLDLLNSLIKANEKYIQAFYYWFCTESVYSYRDVRYNDVIFEIISPLEYYRIDSGNLFVEDDDYGMREFEVNINDIIGEYQEILSKKDIAYIKDIIHNHESTGEYAVTPLMLRSREIAFNPTVDTQSSAPYHSLPSTGVLKAHHCVFKIPMKRGILSYTNAYGEIEQKVVDEDYVLDPTIGDIDIEYTYVLQCWEAYRFGDKDWGVYTKAQPCVVQREEVNNLNHCKLPYNGLSRLMLLNNPKPIPYRLLPYLALYRLYTLVEERTIMKFRSWLLIPESFLADTNDMTMEERLDAANRDGTLVFDDSEIAKQQPSLQAIKEIANTTMINYLTVLNQIKQSIKQEAYELANMNDQRAGDIQARAGKAVTEMGLNQALMGSVWSLKIFDSFRSRDMEANLDAAKIAWIDDFEGSYIDPNTNEVIQVRVNGTDFVNSNFGIFVGNSAELNEQVRKLEEIAFSAAQNGNFDVAAEAVCNHNVASLRKYIKEAADAQRKFELEREEIQKKWDAEIEQMRSANSEAQRKFDAEQAQLDRDSKEAIAADSNLTQIIVNDAKLQVDKDSNGYISEDESNANSLDAYLKMTKLNLDIDRANLERAKFEEQKRMNRINANKPRKP